MELGDTEVERIIKSGRPFTYRGLLEIRRFIDERRVIAATLQKLRKSGLIACSREGRCVVWRQTEAGRALWLGEKRPA